MERENNNPGGDKGSLRPGGGFAVNQNERRIYLIRALLEESGRSRDVRIPEDEDGQRRLLRGLMNVRMPKTADGEFLAVQDEYLSEEIRRRGITELSSLTPVREGLYIWQGDITTLRCDAIVNAANSGLTGCYIPNHGCIDNCIHTYAGIQLRLKCAELIEAQGFDEPAGRAKITPAYNLPCRYVIHTVGPVVTGTVTRKDKELLTSCYRSCLELAAASGLESIAFCCISTGVFCFPNDEAAHCAVSCVEEFMKKESGIKKVVFNVFKDADREIYRHLLRTG